MERAIKGFYGLFIAGVLSLAVLSGCGGGGGGGGTTTPPPQQAQKLSGVAAAGLPVVGYVYLKDSANNTLGPNPIASDGSFTFDITGLTAPFYLRAKGSVVGTSYDLYSATTTSGTANINPLTNLAVAAAAGVSDPSTAYNNQTAITQANLDKAVTDIQNMLKPLLDAYNANINPITGAYTADHTGLDAVFDVVAVNIDTTTGSVAIVNNVTDATIASGTTTTLSTTTDTVTQTEIPPTQTVTDLQAIQTMFSQFATAINKGASLTLADLEPFYATNYGINDGLNRTQTINDELSDFQGFTKTITSANLTIDAMGADYKVNGFAYLSDGSFGFWEEGVIVTKEGGSWKFKGNGYKSEIDFSAETNRWIKADGTVQTESGFNSYIEDNGNYALQSARITGPGLPAGEITLSKPANEPVKLWLDTQYQNNTIPTDSWNFYVMSDTAIGSISDNSTYTIEIYDANNALIETRTRKFSKRPFMRSELTDGHFPTFGGITSHSISAANIGGTLTFTYAKPTAFLTAWMEAGLDFWDYSGNHADYWRNLLLNQSSGSIISGAPSWTPMQGKFQIEAEDEFRREVRIKWMFQ